MEPSKLYVTELDLGVNNSRWEIGNTGVYGTPSFDMLAVQKNNSGYTGPHYSMVKNPLTLNRGRTLVVDSVNGDDSIATIYPYSYPFRNVQTAINSSSPGDTVYIYPGNYEEAIDVKSGIAVRGINVQTVSIQKTNVTTNTTLAKMNNNCRLEDVTLNLTGATGGITLIGLEYLGTSAQTGKLRTAVVNVSNYDSKPSVAFGIVSSGSTPNNINVTSSNSVRACTVNVNLGSTGSTGCGILVNGNNIFSCRDTNIYASGPTGYTGNGGTHIAGVCSDVPNGSTGGLNLYTSTVYGATYDVARPSGDLMLLGFTNLINSTTDGNSFSTGVQASATTYSLTGNFSTGTNYYLIPGTQAVNNAQTTSYGVPVDQGTIIISVLMKFTGTIAGGESLVVNIYKNSIVSTPEFTYTFTSADGPAYTKIITNKSITFKSNDEIIVNVLPNNNFNQATLLVRLNQY